MKKILSIFCFVSLYFSSTAQVVEKEKELLWEISGNGLKEKSYLFGSLHSNDKRLFLLADSVYFAMNKSKMIVLETNVFSLFDELDTRKKLPSTLYDKNGNPYTSSNTASQTFYGTEDGMPQFLDAYFEEYAYNAGKAFFALESVSQQIEMAGDFPVSERKLVNNTINDFTQEKLVEMYLKGDLYALDKFMRVNLSVQKDLYDKLIVKRNLQMTQRLDSLLKAKQNFFCAVGAGHLAGTEGIISLLRSKGYRLRPMLWTLSEIPTPAKKEVKSKKQYLYQDPKSHLIAHFNGKPFEKVNEDGSIRLVYRDLGQGNAYEIEIVPMDQGLSEDDIANIYIASPQDSPVKRRQMDDGTIVYFGLSDTYPEGLNWVQIIFSEGYFAVLKTYGGNKFMHSDRPKKFFDKVWFEDGE